MAFFLFLQSVALAVTIPRGDPPDEMAHIAYVLDATHSATLLPDYANGEILNSGKKNYLGHPPLYYSALGIFSKVFGFDAVTDYKLLRILSGLFVALGFFFWLLAARNFGVGIQNATLFTLACCAIPMFGYLSGSINNDTLVYLGVGACFFGLSRFKFQPESSDVLGVMSFTLGVLVTFLTKATAAAFLTFFLIAILALRWRDLPKALRNPLYQKAVVIIAAVCGAYYLYAIIRFGSPMPKPAALYATSPPHDPVSIFQFSLKYAGSMWDRLPVIMSHASTSPISDRAKPFFYAMMLLPVLGWLVSRPLATSRGASRAEILIGDAFVFAMACTIIINIYVTYSAYLHTGLYAGWQPRYFFFAIPGIWLAMFMTRPSIGLHAALSTGFGVCICVAFWSGVPFLLAKQARPDAQNATVIHKSAAAMPSLSINARLSTGVATGHLDEMKFEDDKLLLRGWSFDTQSSRPTQRIWVLVGGRYVGSAPTTFERPDVAKALKIPSALKSGFSISILGLPKNIHYCEIALLAELSDGTLMAMRSPDCKLKSDK